MKSLIKSNYLEFDKFLFYLIPFSMILGNASMNVLSILFILYLLLKCDWNFFLNDKFIFLIILLNIYLIFNAFISQDIILTLKRNLFYFRFCFIYFFLKYFFSIKKNQNFKTFLPWLILIFLISLDVILQKFTGENILNFKTAYPGRSSSFFFDELIVGHFLYSFGFISCIYFFYKKNYYLFFIFVLLILFSVLCSGERANSIRSIIMFLGILFLIRNFINKKKIFSFLIISLSLLSIIILTNNSIKSRMFESYSRSNELVSNHNFIQKYLNSQWGAHAVTSYLIFKENILLGSGGKSFRNLCQTYQKFIKDKNYSIADGCSTHPHQVHYELLSEYGLIGWLFLIFFVYALIKIRINDKLIFINKFALLNMLIYFIPLIPTGSFFSTVTSFTFWVNLSFFLIKFNLKDK